MRRHHLAGMWSLLIALLLVATMVPVRGVAQDDGTPPAELPAAEIPAEPVEPVDVVVEPEAEAPIVEEPVTNEPVLDETDTTDPVTGTDPEVPAEPDPVIEEEAPASEPDAEVTESSGENVTEESASEPDPDPVVVPENADSLWIAGGVTTYTLQQGESLTIPVTYSVTTLRTSTTIAAELVNAPEGWTMSAAGFEDGNASATVGNWVETATLEPGTTFTLSITITAPVTVETDHSVGLRVWSTAAGVNGEETGVAWSDVLVATIAAVAPTPKAITTLSSAAARPSTPSISCVAVPGMQVEADVVVIDADGSADFTCTVLNGPVQLSLGPAGITSGWWLSVDASSFGPTFTNSGAQVDGSFPVSMKLADSTTYPGPGRLELAITPPGAGNADIVGTATMSAKVPQAALAPTVSIQGFAFAPLTWDGSQWGTTSGQTTVTVQRDTPGDFRNYSVQVQVLTTPFPGQLEPTVTGASSDSDGITASGIISSPILSPVTVAVVDPRFHGTGEVDLTFALTPDNNVPAGEHTMTIRVTTVVGQ